MSDHPIIIGRPGDDRVQIAVRGYTLAQAGADFYGDNSVVADIELVAGGFRAAFEATCLATDLTALHEGLHTLYRTLKGGASFETLGGQLRLELAADHLGHIAMVGSARDGAGSGNRLAFEIDLDQTDLVLALATLSSGVEAYPPRTDRRGRVIA